MKLTAKITKSTTAPYSITIMRDGKEWHTYDLSEIEIESEIVMTIIIGGE